VKALLDTNAFLWFVEGQPRLSDSARGVIEDVSNDMLVSSGSLWEIAIKVSLGKLEMTEPFGDLIPRELRRHLMTVLPASLEHFARLVGLPFHHRDPFDRLFAAQALVEGVPIISPDSIFDTYGLRRIW
jgi:PIN domain nuclease of toxin-antitoxin system